MFLNKQDNPKNLSLSYLTPVLYHVELIKHFTLNNLVIVSTRLSWFQNVHGDQSYQWDKWTPCWVCYTSRTGSLPWLELLGTAGDSTRVSGGIGWIRWHCWYFHSQCRERWYWTLRLAYSKYCVIIQIKYKLGIFFMKCFF